MNSKLLGTVLITINISSNVFAISFEARKSRRERANKAKSAGNLDDLDSMLDTMISTGTPQMRSKKRDEASTFDLFTKEGKNEHQFEASAKITKLKYIFIKNKIRKK